MSCLFSILKKKECHSNVFLIAELRDEFKS